MSTYHVFGPEEHYTIVEFDASDACRGETESWEAARDSVIKSLARDLAAYPSTFIHNLSYVRLRKLLHHIRQCATFSDFYGGIRYQEYLNSNDAFPLA